MGDSGRHDAPPDPNARDANFALQPLSRPEGTAPPSPWDWFAAERIAVAVAGGAAADLDAAHAILIHLYEKVPTSLALGAAIERGVSYENLWSDDRFIAAVWTIAANKLTDLRRAALRRRSPKFRRPSSTNADPDGWLRYPPHFRLVSADTELRVLGEASGLEVADGATTPGDQVVVAEVATVSRAIVAEAITQMRRADAVVIGFVYVEYAPEVHGVRVDEALASHLSARSGHQVSRDAARRRLTDARIRLEDTIVALHRHALLDLVRRLPSGGEPAGESARVYGDGAISLAMRTALLTYLSIVGTRPREVVLEAAHAAVLNAMHPASTPWRKPPRDFVGALLGHVRALFVRYRAQLGAASEPIRTGDDPQ